jgi:hypothetical protein
LQEKDTLEMELTKKAKEVENRELLLEEEKKNGKHRAEALEDVAKDKDKVINSLKEEISGAKEEAGRR